MRPHSSWVIAAVAGLAVSATASATKSAQLEPNTLGPASKLGEISDIRYKGKTSLDTGLDVGFVTELRVDRPVCAATGSACAHQTGIDDVYISVNGRVGTIGLVRTGGDMNESLIGGATRASDRALSYLTPRYGGVQLGVTLTQSATPLLPGLNLGALTPRDPRERDSNALSFGANYSHAFNRVTLSLSGTHVASRDVMTPALLPETSLRWSAGAEVSYGLRRGRGALVLSGSIRDLSFVAPMGGHAFDSLESTRWDAGLSYAKGPFSLGGTISDRSYAAQAGYRFGRGQIAGGVEFWNALPDELLPMGFDGLRETRSTIVFIETALDF